MSMDSKTDLSLRALVEKILPKVHRRIKDLLSVEVDYREPNEKLIKALNVCIEQLLILHHWTGDSKVFLHGNELMDDQEADALLAEATELTGIADIEALESDTGALGDPLNIDDDSTHEMSDDQTDQEDADGLNEEQELSDEEMAAMMNDDGNSASISSTSESTDELTDEQAAALLGDEGEMGDEQAMALLAQMDGKVEAKSSSMSDDQARKLLEQMDGGNGNEISDEAARLLLEEMDSPLPATKTESKVHGTASTAQSQKREEPKKQPPKILSAEDEAAALLAQLGGEDEEEDDSDQPMKPLFTTDDGAAAPPVGVMSQGGGHEADSHGGSGEVITEIDEWIPNDFQTDPDMVSDFNENSAEIMDNLDEQILNLENDPSSKEIIEEIFRAAHTLKGAAGMFGFSGLERVVHRMENLFDLIRKGKLTPTSAIVDVMFGGLDVVRELLQAVKAGKPCGVKTASIVRDLSLLAEGKAALGKPTESKAAPKAGSSEGEEVSPAKKDKKADKSAEVSTIRVDLNRLDVLVNLVGELVIDRTRFVTIEEELRTRHPEVKLSGNISETVQLFGRHMNEIQDIIMKVRMVPIGNAFNKYPRIVRDLAKQLGKDIELVISGEGAELDKTLVEQIGDPLIHLIRNSCDHGIELPEVRKAAGKSTTGTIYLSAHQEGNHIVISIEDDGKGIPVTIIRKKAIEKGMIKEDDKLSQKEILNLIFEPGFSTAEKVTNVSGRGVGMDVVKRQIMKLKGMLEVESEEGRGSTITIRLPLTLAIVQSLLIRAKDEIFAIPLGSVIESIRIQPQEIQKVGDSEVIKLRDKVLPLMHLDRELHLDTKKNSLVDFIDRKQEQLGVRKNDRLFVVVVGSNDRPFGILVDQLLNQQEMVIKSMGRLMKKIPCVAGGAVLGNGEVVLVLDIAELEQLFRNKHRTPKAA